MVVQLRNLEKALEDFVREKQAGEWESLIDKYLDENANITVTSSAKLHDMLYNVWLNDDLLKRSREVSDSIISLNPEPHISKPDPRVFFMHALNRLAPCLINKDQLGLWWDELAGYAIDSTGLRLDVSDQALQFIRGVISGSFYEYCDSSQSQLVEQNIMLFGRNVLETYLSVKHLSKVKLSDERTRFIRQNCRNLFTLFAQRYTLSAFNILDEYFVQPRFRLQLLDLVVECFSESQTNKLFKVYESTFFESLLTCLERDRSRIIIQLAISALSMIMVHICHKLTTDNLLFRVFAIFGRAASWQSEKSSKQSKLRQNDLTLNEEDDPFYMEEFTDPSLALASASTNAPTNNTESNRKVDGWDVYEEEEILSADDEDKDSSDNLGFSHSETIKVVSLFTFLYGLFPINTIQFCHHCDEYFAKHNYQRRFKDYWSRFMVTGKAERIIRQFRVDPMLVTSNEEAELSNAVERFQKLGSALALSSICMSRRVVDISATSNNSSIDENSLSGNDNTDNSDVLSNEDGDEDVNDEEPALKSTDDEKEIKSRGEETKESTEDVKAEPGAVVKTAEGDVRAVANNQVVGSDNPLQYYLDNHRAAFQMETPSSAAHWYRELLLMRNELAFANFSRDMSEQRALRWQKRTFNLSVIESKNEELTTQNKALRAKVLTLEADAQKAIRSARTILRERSAYEAKILSKNKDFRSKVDELSQNVEELTKEIQAAKEVEKAAESSAEDIRNKYTQIDRELINLKNDYAVLNAKFEASSSNGANVPGERRLEPSSDVRQVQVREAIDQQEITNLKYELEQRKIEQIRETDSLRTEIAELQRQLSVALSHSRIHSANPSSAVSPQGSPSRSDFLLSSSLLVPNPPLSTSPTSITELGARKSAVDVIIQDRDAVVARLRSNIEELSRRCIDLEHELRTRKIYEEERLNELQASLASTRPYMHHQDVVSEGKFRGRGGAQGTPRRHTQL